LAVQRFREYSRSRGFAYPARAGEKIRLADPAKSYRIFQRCRYVFLADYLVKILRPPFAGKYKV
jgi:hypothetical protein